jgi:predicted HAD superfamily Cof-like phosphohydrolase
LTTNTKSNAQRVADFHQAAGVIMPERPTLPPPDLAAFRQKLIDEEYAEVTAAFQRIISSNGSGSDQTALLADLAHELSDLLYVAYGALLACGLDADAVFAEVHRANMQKVDGPRRADGKVLKPANWQPADVASIINGTAGKN